MRILVVDDDHALVELVSALLESEGYAVQTAFNGAEALHYASERPPDLVLLDLRMPVMDGWTCCRLMKEHPETAGIPVIVMSADGVRSAIRANLEVDYFLRKPFDVTELLSHVREFVVGDTTKNPTG